MTGEIFLYGETRNVNRGVAVLIDDNAFSFVNGVLDMRRMNGMNQLFRAGKKRA